MRYLIAIIAWLNFYAGNSQNCDLTFTGYVTDFHDGSPIVDATVYLKELNSYTTTDFDGKFTLKNICSGEITITVSHLNCETKTIVETITTSTTSKITMEHHTESLEEVTVRGTGAKNTISSLKKSVLNSETLENYSSGSVGNALKEIAGVSTLSTGNNIVKPIINGLHSSRVVIMNNNVRLQDQEWGEEHAPNIDINSTENIVVIKGSGALAYSGDAIGGVVILNPKKPIASDSLYGKIMATGQSNGRGYNGSGKITKTYKNQWFLSAQGSYKKTGDLSAPNYNLSNTGNESKAYTLTFGKNRFEWGFNAYYSFVGNQIGILSASHIGNIEDLVDAINSGKPLVINDFSYTINAPKQDVTHHLTKASFYKRFQNLGKLDVQYDFQNNNRLEFDKRIGDNKNKAALDLRLKTHTLSSSFKFDSNSERVFNTGILVRYQDNFANPETGIRRLIPDYKRYDFGAYLISKFNLSEKTILDAGVRYDYSKIDALKYYLKSRWIERGYDKTYSDIVVNELKTQLLTNPVFNYNTFSSSVGISYSVNDYNSFLFNYSLSNRAPNPAELFSDGLHHSAARIELGDLNIKQETSHRFSGTYTYQSKTVAFSAEPFVNSITNFIYNQPSGTQNTIRGAFPVWEYSQTNALLWGVDASLSYSFLKKWQLSNTLGYVKGTDIKNNQPLINIPAFNTNTILSFTNKNWNGFKSSLKSEVVLQQNDFPNNNFMQYIATQDKDVLVDISSTPKGYHLLHFSSSMAFKIKNKSQLTIGFQLNNIFNTAYRNYLNRLRYFADDIGRNIMIQTKLNF